MKKNLKTPISKILYHLMYEHGLCTAELAREIGMPQPTLQRLVAGMTAKPHQPTLVPLANYFNLSVKQLLGEEPINIADSHLFQHENKKPWISIPLLSWQELGKDDSIGLVNKQTILTDANVSEKAFALVVEDSAMIPYFPEGSTIICDPLKPIKDRHFVAVRLRNGEATVRQLIKNMNKHFLKPTSPEFSQVAPVLLSEQDTICGVVAQAVTDYL